MTLFTVLRPSWRAMSSSAPLQAKEAGARSDDLRPATATVGELMGGGSIQRPERDRYLAA